MNEELLAAALAMCLKSQSPVSLPNNVPTESSSTLLPPTATTLTPPTRSELQTALEQQVEERMREREGIVRDSSEPEPYPSGTLIEVEDSE